MLRPNRRTAVAGLTVAGLMLASCAEETSIPTDTIVANRSAVTPSASRQAEEIFQELAREVPGFGGYYLERDGSLVAYVTDTSQGDQLRQRLASMVAARRLNPDPSLVKGVEVRLALFDFPSLAR